MKNRKWQRILSWILTLTMLLGTFESNIIAVNAMDDEAIEADAEIDEADVVEGDGDVEEPEDDGQAYVSSNGISIEGSLAALNIDPNTGEIGLVAEYGKEFNPVAKFTAKNAGDTVTWKLYEENTWKEAALPAGLQGTAEGTVYTISGTPTAVQEPTTYKLNVVSANGTASANALVQITVNPVYTGDIEMSAAYALWNGVKMGYTVDASAAASSTNVVPKTITLTNGTGIDLTGLTVKLTGSAKDSFDLTGAGTDVSIAKNGTLDLTVAPKAGLVVKGLKAGEVKTFSADITISANYLSDWSVPPVNEITIPVEFNLVHDMAVTATKAGEAFTGNKITVSAGNAMPTLVFTATGGNGSLAWQDNGIQNKLPAGVTANRNGAVLTISGTPSISADAVKSYSFDMVAYDNASETKDNNTISGNFTIEVVKADVSYKVNGEDKLSVVKTAAPGYYQEDVALTVTAKNNGESAVKVNATLDNANFSFYPDKKATKTIDLAAGASADLKIYPETSVADETVKITFSGDAIETTTVTYRLICKAGVLLITEPADGKLTDAVVGEKYSYTFKSEGTVSANVRKWSISDNAATISANVLKDTYGLTLSDNGVLSGTPKTVSPNGIKLLVTVSGDNVVSTNEVTLKIVSTNSAIVVSANGVELKGKTASDNVVDLGTVNTKLTASSISNNTAKIWIKNTSEVDLGNVDFSIVKTEKLGSNGKYTDTALQIFDPANKAGVVNSEFTVSPNVALIGNNFGVDNAGTYRALCKVNTNANIVAKEFYVTLTIKNAIEITGANKPLTFDFNKEVKGVSFNAVSLNSATNLKDVTWSWTASGNSSLPEGLTLDEKGNLTGTPTKAGSYDVSVNAVYNVNQEKDTKSFTITVSGTSAIALTKGNGDAIDNVVFDGIVNGDEIKADELEVAVKITQGEALSDVKISLEDVNGYTGSASHFKLSTDTIAKINKGGFEKFTVVPVGNTESGTYAAKVVVSSNAIEAKSFTVWFTVADKLTIKDIPADKLVAEVGQTYKLTVSAASISYNKVVQDNDITWTLAEVSANGAILSTGYLGKGLYIDYTNNTVSKNGAFNYVVSANLPVSSNGNVKVPAQKAEIRFTVEVSKSASVNVISANGAAGSYTTGKVTPEKPSASNNVTAYTFASRAEGYTDTNKETVSFTVKNSANIALEVSGNATSTDFVVTDGGKASLNSDATRVIKVAPKAGLKAGTYTADLVIDGAEVAEKKVALSFTVEAARDSIEVSSNNVVIADAGLTLKATKKGVAAVDTTVNFKNTGNVDINVVSINEVLDANGTDIDINDTSKFKLTIGKASATGAMIPDDVKSFTIRPTKTDVAGEYTTYVKITYTVGTSIKTPVVFKVNYTVYKDSVSVNVTPSDNSVSINGSASVSENYSTAYSVGFTVANGEAGVAGDTTEALYDLRVSLSGNDADKFVLTADKVSANSTEYGADVVAKGASYSFSVAAVSGLSYGEYSAELTISANNMTTIKKTVTFTVTGRATSFATDATSAGVSVNVAVDAQRLYNTLAAASGVVSANDADKVWFSVSNDVVVSFNTVSRDNAVVYFATGHTTTKPSITVSAASINTANAVSDNKGNKYFYNTVTFNLFDIVTFDAKGGKIDGKDTVSVNVVNGGKLGTLPSVSKNNASLKTWLDEDNYEVTAATTVTKDMKVTASWSTHHYPASVSGDTASVNWTWNGSASNNYAGTYVTIYCTDADCPDRAASAIKLDATVTKSGKDASCVTGAANVFTASASKDGNTYTDSKTVATGEGLGHEWKFDTSSVVWAKDYSSATISKNCVAKHHDVERDGDKKVGVTTTNISFNGTAATCTTSGNGVYTATFTSADDPAISENIVVSVSLDVIEAFGHKWGEPKVNWTATFNDTAETAKAEFVFTCERDAAHVETLSADKIEVVSSNDTEKEFKATVSFNEKTYTDTYKALNHTEHVWDVKFTWVSVSTNKADTVVTAEATCKNGGEKVELPVTLEDKTVGSKIQYTAIATDGNGKVWKETKNIDTKNGDIKDGPAGTPTVEGGDIVIIGVEETYAFTGSKIKPAITVMDGDIVLAETTDYTYKVTGKNKIGEINKVEVTGKGNYAGKSATAQFTIVDPRTEVEAEELADNVKKVTVSEKKFTYDGTAKYPATVTVDLKDKTQIVYTYDGDGEYSTDSEKKVGLSFSNNVKKGTATVAAYGGKDKSPKKATYKIEAADIASAEFEISAVDWAVKAATPDITATIQLGDETVELVAGQDYKVSFTAKAAGKGTAKISGKGNFKGKHADVAYDVNALEITENNIIVKALAGKKVKDVKVTVVDGLGNTINKKFYTVEVQDAEGNALDKKAALPEEIKVVVKAANASITTADDGVSVDVKTGKDISKVKGAFKVDKAFYKTYTGEPITLDADDFGPAKIVVGELELDTDFAIVGYKNNIKKGTMTVTVEGRGDYSGTKTFKVKIKAKPLDQAVKED